MQCVQRADCVPPSRTHRSKTSGALHPCPVNVFRTCCFGTGTVLSFNTTVSCNVGSYSFVTLDRRFRVVFTSVIRAMSDDRESKHL
jgi:hypothetical protein